MAELIGIDDALALIRSHVELNEVDRLPLSQALGSVLAEDIASDIDSPPHDKALMDGYAVRSSDVVQGPVCLRVLEEVTAGDVPRHAVLPGTATRIMTGAPLPDGADAVVMVEQTAAVAGDSQVEIHLTSVAPETAVMRQGASVRQGQTVVPSGRRLRAVEIGVLAEAGRSAVDVIRQPQVALVQTGNELVAAGQDLLPGQIRNSNGPMIAAMVQHAGAQPRDLGIARDDQSSLSAAVDQGLRSDILILSGGVSAGVLDLVPMVLTNAGVVKVFHKVNIRPGKPIWFGVADSDGSRSLVFGLPGNPVSSLVCFLVFVAPAIAACAGREVDGSRVTARLAKEHTMRGTRPTFWPATRQSESSVLPLDWQGSADLFSLADADSLIFFPEGNRGYAAGEQVAVLPLH